MTTQSKVLLGIGVVIVLALIIRRKTTAVQSIEAPAASEVPVNFDTAPAAAADFAEVNAAGQIPLPVADPAAIEDDLTREYGDDVVGFIPEPVEEVMWPGVSIQAAFNGDMEVPREPLEGAGIVQDATVGVTAATVPDSSLPAADGVAGSAGGADIPPASRTATPGVSSLALARDEPADIIE